VPGLSWDEVLPSAGLTEAAAAAAAALICAALLRVIVRLDAASTADSLLRSFLVRLLRIEYGLGASPFDCSPPDDAGSASNHKINKLTTKI
jgi:hypothetical protein